jgi:hypothetical protein
MFEPEQVPSIRPCESFHRWSLSIPDRVRTGHVVAVDERGTRARVGVQLAPPVGRSRGGSPIVFLALGAASDACDVSRIKRWLVSRAPLRVCREGGAVELLQPRTGQRVQLRYQPRPLRAR